MENCRKLSFYNHPSTHLICFRGTDVACYNIWATSWQNLQNDLCTQRRLRLAWASIHPVWSEFFAVCMKKHWVLSYPLSILRRLWSDWTDAQTELNLRWGAKVILLVLSWGGSVLFSVQSVAVQNNAVQDWFPFRKLSLLFYLSQKLLKMASKCKHKL